MKKRLLVGIVFSLLMSTLTAQNVKIKNGIAKVDGKKYCKTDCHFFWVNTCKILTLSNQVIATINFHAPPSEPDNISICEIVFANTMFFSDVEYRAQIRINFNYRQQIIREFYRFQVLQFGQLDELGVKNFVRAYSQDYLGKKELSEAEVQLEETYKVVKRNTKKPIFIGTKSIEQDFKDIGTYELQTIKEGDETKHEFSIYLPNGTLIAKAKVDHLGENSICYITATKNNETWATFIRARFMTEQVVAIAKELTLKGYL